jgi:diketogulonate reductase-like aldo/keto reductase
MPIFGLGLYRSAAGEEAQQAVLWAIKHGYLHFDTAAVYRLTCFSNTAGAGYAFTQLMV